MKKFIYILLTVVCFTACDLTEVPYTVSKENLKDSPDGADLYLSGTYNTFWSSYMMKKTYMEWIDMDHDHASAEGWVVSGAGMGNVTTHWGYNGGSDLFMVFYRIINRANFAIENIPAHTAISEEKKNQLIGEAYFLRAFSYFHLARMYGPVPLRLTYITERDIKRASIKEVYDQIVADLKKADESMSMVGMPETSFGRAGKGAAKLLLAKVYAHMGSGALSGTAKMNVDIKGTMTTFTTDPVAGYNEFDAKYCYEQVVSLCNEVIELRGKEFDLMPNFKSLWGSEGKRCSEIVWAIVGYDLNDFKVEHLNYYYTPVPFGGRGWAGIAKTFYSRFEENDNRIADGVFHYMKRSLTSEKYERFPDDEKKYGTGPDGNPTTYSNFSDLVFIKKWYTGKISDPSPVAVDPVYTAQDIPMLRFAEAYLLRAEAFNELGKPQQALADLDVIRARANASLKSGKTSDQLEIRSMIYEERAFEFAQEFNRKFDLTRWGLYLKVMNETMSVPTKYGSSISKIRESRSVLYAVPTSETTVNKLFGPNNTGW